MTGTIPVFLQYPPPHPTLLSAVVGARCEFLDTAMLDHVRDGDHGPRDQWRAETRVAGELGTPTPAKVATYAYVNPVIALLLGYLLDDEVLSAWTIGCSTVVVAAVLLVVAK